jgi:hypothetical protein
MVLVGGCAAFGFASHHFVFSLTNQRQRRAVAGFTETFMLCRKLLINTRLQPGARKVREAKKPFKRFFVGTGVFTALKRGVNEMISTEQDIY